ncbi:MAG: hypothetical protein HRT88_20005 [Lentisphaeraceae bacterium]|nr:hypothetical protein [Lentisphaeraceae bacterium]
MKKLLYATIPLAAIFLLSSCKSFPHTSTKYTLKQVSAVAGEKGINALIHGADQSQRMYVASWSNPQSFFNRYNFSIYPGNRQVAQSLAQVKRGDRIFIKGEIEKNGGQPHMKVEHMEIKKAYEPQIKHPAGHFERRPALLATLKNKRRETFYIHAVENEGNILVLEYGDTVIPMIVKNNELTKNLYRGDYVRIAYKINISDKRPTHLTFNHQAKDPLQVKSSIVKLHEKEVNYEGRLVMFPKSPTINRNIFAVEVKWQDGKLASRYFTILPKDFTGENFAEILKKLQTTWDKYPQAVFKGRNKYIHHKIRVQVKGKANIVSENQANAQIFADIDNVVLLN